MSSVLQLLDWRELEALVTGPPEIDLALLREHTVCRGGDKGEETVVERLWVRDHESRRAQVTSRARLVLSNDYE